MGLDAYVYIDHSETRRAKLKAEIDNVDISKTLKSVESLLTDGTETSKRLAYALDKFIEHFGYEAAEELKNVLRDMMHDECVEVEPESINMEEVAYFRKCWFLNSYFDYGDEWYAQCKPVSRQQIETLKSLCDKVETAVKVEKKKRGSLSNKECGDIARKILEDEDVWYYEVENIKNMCTRLLCEVEWETDKVYYEADW